jgi:adenine-specific DNA-methyltransferase
MAKKSSAPKSVEVIKHEEAKRKNIPTAEYQSVVNDMVQEPIAVYYERRNKDLDPQLVWRGKDVLDWSDLVVLAPPLYIQEKVHPKAIIDDLLRQTKEKEYQTGQIMADLFADFNGVPKGVDKTEFYQHHQNWSNRMILGDSLQVMASLAEREGLRGQVQCIYFDPPYGIKFNSNFQWSTTNRDVRDGKADHITREPEQVKAFRDTWRDGIHSYLTYLRDRLMISRDLLNETGSIFLQIGDENVHRVRALMDEVFGEENIVSQIAFRTTTGRAGEFLSSASNYILWFAKNLTKCKYRSLYSDKMSGSSTDQVYTLIRDTKGTYSRINSAQRIDPTLIPSGSRLFRPDNLTSQSGSTTTIFPFEIFNKTIQAPKKGGWKTNLPGMQRLAKADRLWLTSKSTLQYIRFIDDFPVIPISNIWTDTGTGSFTDDKIYVVQTASKVVERCLLMATGYRPWRSCGRSDLWIWNDSSNGRALGPALDYDRYFTCRLSPCTHEDNGCKISLLSVK